ncbi:MULTISPECIES: glycosyltransferase family 2 protein [Lactobacillus]|uniref:Glycosyltransferase family 2 protein n=1 Tax=Lactobacillus xujianguonis TaxID=2495899 RepID=A0A437SVI2_9LACO|nr:MULTISPECIES: glycosyltransferase family 2 protein [Lactobacillus]RVU70936.1 glycosyltransferase family 2 protein [Lactobacillus xujianguonis]
MKKNSTEPVISIIIPIYNVEKYLKRCLDSVEKQIYTNLEIILINDGSTDDSLVIAEEYAKKDSRIKIFSETNHGLSAARNLGLKHVTGEYITFIDSDDYVSNDYVSYLYSLLEKSNFTASMSICSLMNVYEDSGKEINTGNNKEYTLPGKECIKMMCYHDLVDTCAYAKLGSKELYNDFEFPEGKVFEDIGTTYQLFEKANKVECGFKPKYFYNIRSNSITTQKFTTQKLDLLEMTDKMADDVVQKYPDLKKAVLRRRIYARFSTLNQTFTSKGTVKIKEIRNELIKFIQKNHKELFFDKNVPKRDKVAYLSLCMGFNFYKSSWNLYSKIVK